MNDAPEAAGGTTEPAQPASSQTPPKDAPPPPPTGGGGDGKGGNGQGDGGGAPKPKRDDIPWIPVLGFLFALAFVGIVTSVFWLYFLGTPKSLDKTLLLQPADTETARGLITFLVSVSTGGIALILIVYLASAAAAGAVLYLVLRGSRSSVNGGDGKGGNGNGDGGGAPRPKPKDPSPHLLLQFFIVSVLPFVAFLLVALAFVAILSSVFLPYAIGWPIPVATTLLQDLADTDKARGLITFLVAVSTVGIALVLIVYLASSAKPNDDKNPDDNKERFGFGKEILGLLIGILGTIVGYYFAAKDQTHGHDTPTTGLTLSKPDIVPPKTGKGAKVTLHATLSGGQPHYKYKILFTPETIKPIEWRDLPDGTINQEITSSYDPAKPLDGTLEGKDVTGVISGQPFHLPATPSPSSGK